MEVYGMKLFRLLLPVIFCFSGCDDPADIPVVKNVDLARYCGKWYEIARLPNRFESDMNDVYALYTLKSDGTIQVLNRGFRNGKAHSATGVAKAVNTHGDGELKVSFFRPFYGSYRIIKLAPDYSYAVVMGNSRKLLWILGRTPELTPQETTEIMEFLKSHAFPVGKLIWRDAPSAAASAK